jgi:protein-disulfide isomerase
VYANPRLSNPPLSLRFLDFTCPFSKKLFDTVYSNMDKFGNARVAFRFHEIVQPWHFQSTIVHEAACVVRAVHPESPDKQVAAWASLFSKQEEFFDVNVGEEGRDKIHARLSVVLEEFVPKETYLAMVAYDPQKIKEGSKNPGCAITQQIKDLTRYSRRVGVHVSPSVYLNGEEQTKVSSGWTMEQWEAFVKGKQKADM